MPHNTAQSEREFLSCLLLPRERHTPAKGTAHHPPRRGALHVAARRPKPYPSQVPNAGRFMVTGVVTKPTKLKYLYRTRNKLWP
jgi:hypothetical protein